MTRPSALVRKTRLSVCVGLIILMVGGATYMLAQKPVRPMFHNRYGPHPDHRRFWSKWELCDAQIDAYGNWMWADYADNMLAIVATGRRQTSRIGPIVPSETWTKFRVGEYHEDSWITVARESNVLILILPSGSMHRFRIGKGLAERIYTDVAAQLRTGNGEIDILHELPNARGLSDHSVLNAILTALSRSGEN